ncbi:hypothetical protein K469DRAFT_693866 [Zopfia rhizophila CBS 207.26]|uniref:Uncharacterized protein n=1 Tax=Zopfia rhizophila CBS 207.26 TaxID=1314779 RepID=A0A6A6D4L9_9PEZI|nr:hypothetical protein K469DRAFT_693866 [Zopfia rhizophila CBS 207.26]
MASGGQTSPGCQGSRPLTSRACPVAPSATRALADSKARRRVKPPCIGNSTFFPQPCGPGFGGDARQAGAGGKRGARVPGRLSSCLELHERKFTGPADRASPGGKPVQLSHRSEQDLRHQQPGQPLPVRRQDVPGRIGRGRGADRRLVGGLVIVPAATVHDVGRLQLPVLVRLVDPGQEALALLLLAEMQEELQQHRPLPGEVALEAADVLQPFVPDRVIHQDLRKRLAGQDLRMHAGHQDLLVPGAIVDADPATGRQRHHVAPEEVVLALQPDRRGEGDDLAALRVDAGEDMLDGTVLARGVLRLEDAEHGPAAAGIEPALQLGDGLDPLLQRRLAFHLGQRDASLVVGGIVLQRESLTRGDAPSFHELANGIRHGLASVPSGAAGNAPATAPLTTASGRALPRSRQVQADRDGAVIRQAVLPARLALRIDQHAQAVRHQPVPGRAAEQDVVDEIPPAPAGIGTPLRGAEQRAALRDPAQEGVARPLEAPVEVAQHGEAAALPLPRRDPVRDNACLLTQDRAFPVAFQEGPLTAAGLEVQCQQTQRGTSRLLDRHVHAPAQAEACLRRTVQRGEIGILPRPQAAAHGDADPLHVMFVGEEEPPFRRVQQPRRRLRPIHLLQRQHIRRQPLGIEVEAHEVLRATAGQFRWQQGIARRTRGEPVQVPCRQLDLPGPGRRREEEEEEGEAREETAHLPSPVPAAPSRPRPGSARRSGAAAPPAGPAPPGRASGLRHRRAAPRAPSRSAPVSAARDRCCG